MKTTLDDMIDRADADIRTTTAEREILGALRVLEAEAEDDAEIEECVANVRRALEIIYGPVDACATCAQARAGVAERDDMRTVMQSVTAARDEALARIDTLEHDIARIAGTLADARADVAERESEIREACEALALATGRSIDDGGLADHVSHAVRALAHERAEVDLLRGEIARIVDSIDAGTVPADADPYIDPHALLARIISERDEARSEVERLRVIVEAHDAEITARDARIESLTAAADGVRNAFNETLSEALAASRILADVTGQQTEDGVLALASEAAARIRAATAEAAEPEPSHVPVQVSAPARIVGPREGEDWRGQGRHAGTVPYGYALDEDGDEPTLLTDQIEADTMLRICAWRDDAIKAQDMAELLNRLGRRTRSGAWWAASAVRGRIQQGYDEWVEVGRDDAAAVAGGQHG